MGEAEKSDESLSIYSALELQRKGQWAEAERLYRQVLERNPNDAKALHLLGMLQHQTGKETQAIELLGRSIGIDPDQPHVLSNYGSLLAQAGRAAEALGPLMQAVRLGPEFAEGHNNLGAALERLGRWAEALTSFERAVALKPRYVEAHTHRGNVLRWFGHIDAAIAAYKTVLQFRPTHVMALTGLGAAYGEAGDVEGILHCQRRVQELWPAPHPSAAAAHSDLLYTLHYDPGLNAEQLFAEHLKWAEQHAASLYQDLSCENAFPNDRDSERILRIGFISADFRSHPVTTFLWAAFKHADRTQSEIYCYSDVARPDAVTERCREVVPHWRETAKLNDELLMQMIREDKIDILVDPTGHAGGNRLPLFARRAAPVQITFNGYVDTTGLRTMDYRLTDAYHDPVGRTERFHTEQLVRLPQGLWCYAPDLDGEPPPDVGPPPFLANGHITFGCLNKPVKMNRVVLELWARLLRQLPLARLLIAVTGGEELNQTVRRRFEAAGIPGDRLDLVAKTKSRHAYLERYRQIDIALDTFPFNGMTTTCDALLMGVPVVTLAGNTHVSRSGVSFLTMAGLTELIAETPDEYCRIAMTLASDLPRLGTLRSNLRGQLLASELCHQEKFAKKLHAVFRTVWRTWCNWIVDSGLRI